MTAHFPSEDTAKNAVKVWSLIKSIKVAMMTTRIDLPEQTETAAEGFDSRPMRSLFEEHADAIWFIVPRGIDIAKAPAPQQRNTLLTYSNGPDGDHVALFGTTSFVEDRTKLKALWNAHADIAFPKGPADPEATLLKFVPVRASFWAGGSDVLSFVVNFIEAKMTGTAPDVGQRGSVPQ